jgi:glutamate transport system substrate-binding protein
MRVVRLIALIVAALTVLVVGITAVAGHVAPSKGDLVRQAGLVGKRQLWIGVKDDQPGIALRDPATGQYSGFDIDIAYLVAADLGFGRDAVRFLPIESKDRARMQGLDGNRFVTVDLVVASYSFTAAREAMPDVHFSAAYLRTAQSVLTRRDHASVQSLNDLRGEVVCSLTTSTSQVPVQQVPGVRLVTKNKISECVSGLLAGEVSAVTTDAAILAGFAHRNPSALKLHAIGMDADERWAINTGSNQPLNTLVNLSLYHSRYDPTDQRWEEAFERNLRPEQPDSLPQEVAIDQQPTVEKDKVRVREWPWETRALPVLGPGPATAAGRPGEW